jgi:hypothetical protein
MRETESTTITTSNPPTATTMRPAKVCTSAHTYPLLMRSIFTHRDSRHRDEGQTAAMTPPVHRSIIDLGPTTVASLACGPECSNTT